jgi:hypothetical protein
MVDTRISAGSKSGGFVVAPTVKASLDALYRGDVSFVEGRARLLSAMSNQDFLKKVVS